MHGGVRVPQIDFALPEGALLPLIAYSVQIFPSIEARQAAEHQREGGNMVRLEPVGGFRRFEGSFVLAQPPVRQADYEVKRCRVRIRIERALEVADGLFVMLLAERHLAEIVERLVPRWVHTVRGLVELPGDLGTVVVFEIAGHVREQARRRLSFPCRDNAILVGFPRHATGLIWQLIGAYESGPSERDISPSMCVLTSGQSEAMMLYMTAWWAEPPPCTR